jgi:hypothetical protein
MSQAHQEETALAGLQNSAKLPSWRTAFLFAGLALVSASLLALLVPTALYADTSRPQGQFFVTHPTSFAPLYTLLAAQSASQGLLLLLVGSIVYIILAGLYWKLLRSLRSEESLVAAVWRSRRHWIVLALIWVGLFGAYPLLSDDGIYYLTQARLVVNYGANPYLPAARQFLADDDWQAMLGPLQSLPLTYGPIWLYLSLPPVVVAGSSLPVAIVALKLVNMALVLLSGVVLWQLLADRAPDQRRLAVLALLWNPLVWAEVLWSNHNDVVMMIWVLLALLAFQRNRPILSMSLLMCGVATKYVPLIGAPLLLAAILRQRQRREYVPLFGAMALACSGVLALCYAPVAWGQGLAIFAGLLAHAEKVNPTYSALVQTAMAPLIGATPARLIMPGLLLALVAFCSWRVWRGAPLVGMLVLLFVGYVFVLSNWLVPWYGIWLVLLALIGHSRMQQAVVGAALYLPSYYLINALPSPAWLRATMMAGVPLLIIFWQWRTYQPQMDVAVRTFADGDSRLQ